MTEKTIFISSTLDEFREERRVLANAYRSLGHCVSVWEEVGASSKIPEAIFIRKVKNADVFVCLLGKHYSEATFSELEAAEHHGKRCLIYFCDYILGERDHRINKWINEQHASGIAPTILICTSKEEMVRQAIVDMANIVGDEVNSERDLPEKYFEFIGRNDEVEKIIESTQRDNRTSSVIGFGGIGKSALARRVAQQIRMQNIYNDVIWIDCSALTPDLSSHEKSVDEISNTILAVFFREIDLYTLAIERLDKKEKWIRQRCSTNDYLIVFDNFESIDKGSEVASRLHGMCKKCIGTIFTSRMTLHLPPEATFRLAPMDYQLEALPFLRMLGRYLHIAPISQANDDTLARIARDTGGSPLAMKWVVGQLRQSPLDLILQDISTAGGSKNSEQFYQGLFLRAWNSVDVTTKQVLRALCAAPGGTSMNFSDWDTVSGIGGAKFREAVRTLLDLCLVDQSGAAGREMFNVHPLIRNFSQSPLAVI